MSDLISRCELFNRLATIAAPPEANELKTEIYKVLQELETIEIFPEEDLIRRSDAIEALRTTTAQYVPFLNGINEKLPLQCEIALRSVPAINSPSVDERSRR